jgi:hypothetical protein
MLPSDRLDLVGQMLGFTGDVAGAVSDRTAGNPLFARQLVGDWVQRGILQAGRDGFEIKKGATLTLPEDLHAVWEGRLTTVLDELPGAARTAVELAAVLGLEVDRQEWAGAADVLGLTGYIAVLEALLEQRLFAQRHQGQFAFAHGMLREVVLETIGPIRMMALHDASSRQLLDATAPDDVLRRGRHRLGAGQNDAGLADLIAVTKMGTWCADAWGHRRLLQEIERRLRAEGSDDSDRRLFVVRVNQAAQEHKLGHKDVAQAMVSQLLPLARTHGWPIQIVRLLRLDARLVGLHGSRQEALVRGQQVLAAAERHDPRQVPEILLTLGGWLVQQGRVRDGEAVFQRCVVESQRHQRPHSELIARLWIATTFRLQGRLRDAAQILRDTGERLPEHFPSRFEWHRESGELARAQGKLEDAERHYRWVQNHLRVVGGTDLLVSGLNLLLVSLLRGNIDSARVVAEEVVEQASAMGILWVEGAARIGLAACNASEGTWDDVERLLSHGDVLVSDAGMQDADIAVIAEVAERAAARAGRERLRKLAAAIVARHRPAD